MANPLLTCSQIINEALKVLEDEMQYIERFDKPIHMKAKGRWQILEWNKNTQKYRVVSEHKTCREAEAFKKLMD